MYRLKKFIRSRKVLYPLALMVWSSLPAWCMYSRHYFQVRRLLRQCYRSDDRLFVDGHVKRRLARVLAEAIEFVPYYRDTVKIKSASVNAENALEALQSFPYLEKKTVMNDPESFISRRYRRDRLLYSTSGGSTGEGIGVWRTENEYQTNVAFFHHEFSRAGYKTGRGKMVVCSSDARKRGGQRPWERQGSYLLVSPYHLEKRWLDAIYKAIIAFRPDYFYLYPSCLASLSRFMRDTGRPLYPCKGIFLFGEPVTAGQCADFHHTFSAQMYSIYSLTEETNFAVSRIGERGVSPYVLNPLYGYSENRNDEFGNPEIVGTALWRTAMPFIRYRTQDYGRIQDSTLLEINGRRQEWLITRTQGRIPGFSIKIDEFTWDHVDVFQVVQEEKGKLVYRIVPKANFSATVKDAILARHKERWGEFFDISIELVSGISRTGSGKQRLIVNTVGVK